MSQQTAPLPTPTRRPRLPRPPFWLVAAAVLVVVASCIPLAIIITARYSTSSQPRIALIQDMAKQPKFREQMPSSVFADGRADRPQIRSTVPRGQLDADDHYYRGYTIPTNPPTTQPQLSFFDKLPTQIQLTKPLLARGQQRFDIYCATCHGLDGSGKGPVNQRALELKETNWVPAADLHTDLVRSRPDGHIFNTISNGIRTMPAYAGQIPVQDRWAIVAYLRALQFSQNAPARVLPPQQLQTLR